MPLSEDTPTILLEIKDPVLRDYIRYLFPEDGGSLKVKSGDIFGKLIIAHVRISDRPVPAEGQNMVHLILPLVSATRNLQRKWLYFSRTDCESLEMALDALFNLDFDRYYEKARRLGYKKQDIVSTFLFSRKIFTAETYDKMHKRAYRREQKEQQRLINRTEYIYKKIDLSILEQL